MTAIAGVISLAGGRPERAAIARVINVLKPYGKDASGSLITGDAAFVRTLLRTTPEDSFDNQPHRAADRNTVMLFDGRIDNRSDLARLIGISTGDLQILSDCEIVHRVFRVFGHAAVSKLEGDFSLAFWESRKKRLILARDAVGWKPLFWFKNHKIFAFATLPSALFALPEVPKKVSSTMMHDFLCLMPMAGNRSFFEDIFRVQKGQILELSDQTVHCWSYHDFSDAPQVRFKRKSDYIEAFKEILDEAVSARLRSNGQVGSELSSGLDSATVTAIAAHSLRPGQRLLAYTAVPRGGVPVLVPHGRHADESDGASEVARMYQNIDHFTVQYSTRSLIDSLREDAAELNRPPLNPCNMLWVNAIRELASRHGVKVLLTAGYGNTTISYEGSHLLSSLFARLRFLRWAREVRAVLSKNPSATLKGLTRLTLSPCMPRALWRWLEKRNQRGWSLEGYSALTPEAQRTYSTASRAKMLRHDFSYQPTVTGRQQKLKFLRHFDVAEYWTAANTRGVDVRDPTADRRLIEFCLGVPDEVFLNQGRKSWLLKEAMKESLPQQVLYPQTKGLQAADWYLQVQDDYQKINDEIQNVGANPMASSLLDQQGLAELAELVSDEADVPSVIEGNYRQRLIRGLSAGLFIRYNDSSNL